MMESKVCQEIESKVIKENLCTLCGACLEVCPYLVAYEGKVILRDVCDLPQGCCSAVCPRLAFNLDNMSKTIFGIPYARDELGTVQQVLMARSNDDIIRARAQDTGTVTALICFALDQGFVDSAVLTLFDDKSWPKGVIVSTRDEVLECSGSSYMATPTLGAFNQARQDDDRKSIAVVGTPCQVMALAKMRAASPEICKNMVKLKLVIGLFCTWALSYPSFAHFLERKTSDHIVKYDVPPHPANVLLAYTEKEHISIPLDKVLPFVMPACHLCTDLTAEFADVSIGSGRGEVLDWNTVIVRTERGMRFIESAIKKGIIETRDVPEGNLSRLKVAADNKKKRALRNIIQKTGSLHSLLYLKGQNEMIKQLIEQ